MSTKYVVVCLSLLAVLASAGTVSVTFENKCMEDILIGANPALQNGRITVSQLTVPEGKTNIFNVPENWKGEFWPILSDAESTIAGKRQKTGNTRLLIDNQKLGIYYYIDVDYGFSYSMKVIPGTKPTMDAGRIICEELEFKAYDCPTAETLTDENNPVDLTVNNGKQCNSPCVAVQTVDSGNLAATMKSLCCPDTEKDCKLEDTHYLKSLRNSGSRLNSFDSYKRAVEAFCKATKFTITVSCTKGKTKARFFHSSTGRMLFYEFYYM